MSDRPRARDRSPREPDGPGRAGTGGTPEEAAVAVASGARPESGGTTQRLLDAAGEVFVERGFRQATVREICARAGANVAAVSYHFGDKQGLYRAAIEHAYSCSMRGPGLTGPGPGPGAAAAAGMPAGGPHAGADATLADAARAEAAFRQFIREFLGRVLAHGRPAWHTHLVTREMIEPADESALESVVRNGIRPNHWRLRAIIAALTGRRAEDPAVRDAAFSIAGQVLYFHFARHVHARLAPEHVLDAHEIHRLAGHIADFSLAGLRAVAGDARARAPGTGVRDTRAAGNRAAGARAAGQRGDAPRRAGLSQGRRER